MVFGRLVTAMITPFTPKQEIDWPRVTDCIEHLIATGTDAIVVAGTTAESPTLSYEETLALFQHTVKQVDGRIKVIAGTGSNNTADSVQLTKEAEKLGVDGIMLVVPYYNKPSQAGIYAHFQTVATATKLPIMLYNVPGRTSINMNVDTMVRLSQIDNIVAFKEASGDLNQISKLIASVTNDIAVYTGDDSITLPVLAVGGAGIVSVASHVIGQHIKEMINAYFEGNVARAAELHKKHLPVFTGIFVPCSPVTIKYVMAQKGMCEPVVRLPLVEMSEQEKIATDKWAKELL